MFVVRVCGLTRRVDLNDSYGVVEDVNDRRRFTVRIGKRCVSIKDSNVRIVQGIPNVVDMDSIDEAYHTTCSKTALLVNGCIRKRLGINSYTLDDILQGIR